MENLKQFLSTDKTPTALVLGAGLAAWAVYFLALGIYRVYFSPLAKFPGPKLAAFTTLYQAYYDIVRGGQYFRKIDRLHAKYGPIIRINPHELHVNDPTFIDELYAGNAKKRDKYKWAGRSVLLPDSLVATQPHDLHRKRRAALNPFFSKANIRKLDPVVQHGVTSVLKRLEDCAKNAVVFPASLAYKAATCDIITEFCFGASTEYIERDDYEHTYFSAVDHHLKMSWMMTYIPGVGPFLDAVPPILMGVIYPGLKQLWMMHTRWTSQLDQIRASSKFDDGRTIFHGLLNSDLPPSEKSNFRLRQEAQLLVLAGQDTTAYTLSSLTYQLLANPEILKKLKAELVEAIPDPGVPMNSADLEQLPYLTAVVEEGIRLHPGALVRQTRVAPEQALFYKDPNTDQPWMIPPGSPVSMDARNCNLNPKFFDEPLKFKPERWIENPRLDRYNLSFSKGTRICLGLNLAYSELYMITAGIFRHYDLYDGSGKQNTPTLALHDTYWERDAAVVSDCLVPFPQKGSKGIQVKVRSANEC